MSEPITWDELWLNVARDVGQKSRCVRAQYGAVIVSRDNRVLAVGYNGPPAGKEVSGRCDSWCARSQAAAAGRDVAADYTDCVTVHAEMNALLRASNLWTEDEPALYVNGVTCTRCALTIANSGVKTVHMLVTPYEMKRDPDKTRLLLKEYGLEVVIHLGFAENDASEDADGT